MHLSEVRNCLNRKKTKVLLPTHNENIPTNSLYTCSWRVPIKHNKRTANNFIQMYYNSDTRSILTYAVYKNNLPNASKLMVIYKIIHQFKTIFK